MSETPTKVTIVTPKLVDVTGLRDRNMQALIVLAVTLGWTMRPSTGDRPVTIIAPDGTAKRIPTNTSIRMSVFATTLSTILTHTPEELVPSRTLITALARQFKLDAEHTRRMRVAVDETPEEHQAHLEAMRAEAQEPPDTHLTQRIEMPKPEPEEEVATEPEAPTKPLTTTQIFKLWDDIALTPDSEIQWKVTPKQMRQWEAQLRQLPHLVEIQHSVRKGDGGPSVTRRALLDNGSRPYICGWPGCRHYTAASPTGHARRHYIAMQRPAPVKTQEEPPVSVTVTEPAEPMPTVDQMLEKYMENALQLLEIANGFVSGFEKLDDYVRTAKGDPQHLIDEIERLRAEVAELGIKAAKYDQLMAVLGRD